jgi:hypothetical protein
LPDVSRALTHLADPNPSWLWIAVVAELVSMRALASVKQRMLAACTARAAPPPRSSSRRTSPG